MIRKAFAGVLCVVSTMAAMPANAQQSPFQQVKARAGKPYAHRHSRVTMPAALDGMARTGVKQIGADELDVIGEYGREADAISIYVFRNVAGSVPVWFDRARWSVEHRPEAYGSPTLAAPVTAFTPPGQKLASGLMAGWTPSAGPYRGTALALLPIDGWWVKVRYSSTTLDGAAVAARLPAVLAELGWPRAIPVLPAATEIAPCADRIRTGADARPVEDREIIARSAILSSLLSGVGRGTPPASFCRDETPLPLGAVYRPDGAADRYMIAMGDSGRAVWAGSDGLGAIMNDGKPATYVVSLVDMGVTRSLPPLDRLPPPTQALSLLQSLPIASSVNSWGSKRSVSINADVLGK